MDFNYKLKDKKDKGKKYFELLVKEAMEILPSECRKVFMKLFVEERVWWNRRLS